MEAKTVIAIVAMAFCNNIFCQGYWTQKSDAHVSAGAVGFSIGSKGYLTTGYGPSISPMWEYDPGNDTWTQMATLPDTAIYVGAGFSIGTKGYVGTGLNVMTLKPTKAFWEWDQFTNTWTRKADFGGGLLQSATGFSIGNKGYIGTGYGVAGFISELWEWDQASDVWIKKASIPAPGRCGTISFSIGSKGYVGTGGSATKYNDFWEWDPSTNVWSQKANFPGTARAYAVGFSIGTKGFIGSGNDGTMCNSDYWEWDQVSNTWYPIANFPGPPRRSSASFSVGGKGYIASGLCSSYYNDFWEYTPDSTIGVGEMTKPLAISIFPNPSNGIFNVSSTAFEINSLEIYNSNGGKVYSISNQTSAIDFIDISSQPSGAYLAIVETSAGVVNKRVLIAK